MIMWTKKFKMWINFPFGVQNFQRSILDDITWGKNVEKEENEAKKNWSCVLQSIICCFFWKYKTW